MKYKVDIGTSLLLALCVPETAKESYISRKLAGLRSEFRFSAKKNKLDDDERRILNKLKEGRLDEIGTSSRLMITLAEKQSLKVSKKVMLQLRSIDLESSNLESCKLYPEFISYYLNLRHLSLDKKNLSHSLSRHASILNKTPGNEKRKIIYSLKKDKASFFKISSFMQSKEDWADFSSSYFYNNIVLDLDPELKRTIFSANIGSSEDTQSMLNFKLKPRDLNTYLDSVSAREFLIGGIHNSDKISTLLAKNKISQYDFLLFLEKISYIHDCMRGKVSFNDKLFERDLLDLKADNQAR